MTSMKKRFLSILSALIVQKFTELYKNNVVLVNNLFSSFWKQNKHYKPYRRCLESIHSVSNKDGILIKTHIQLNNKNRSLVNKALAQVMSSG